MHDLCGRTSHLCDDFLECTKTYYSLPDFLLGGFSRVGNEDSVL